MDILITKVNKNKIDKLSENELEKIIEYANKNYYASNQKQIFTDEVYDKLKDRLEKLNPQSKLLTEIGYRVEEKFKIKLPYFMGSLTKIKNNSEKLKNWINKFPNNYIISEKLDGISALFINENNKLHLYNRGDGTNGTDISNIITNINLKNVKIDNNYAIRGELIMSKNNFNKYKVYYKNSRNLVNGVVNAKNMNPKILNDIDFVAYEIINPILTPNDQLEFIKKLNIKVVKWENANIITNDYLINTLYKFKKNSEYDIDGIVITHNKIYERLAENPKYSFAFKQNLNFKITTVIDVIWNVSKNGLLKPKIKIEPIEIGGTTITSTSGFNAKYIVDNKINVGSEIKITRSGDVIPYIEEVLTKSKTPLLPNVNFKWNNTNVDLIALDKDTKMSKIKNIENFVNVLNIMNISSKTIEKFIENGFDTINKFVNMNKEDILSVMKTDKISNKIYNNIQSNIKNVEIIILLEAINVFPNLGKKKLKLLFANIPNFIDTKPTLFQLNSIKGFSDITSNNILENYHKIKEFLLLNNNIKYVNNIKI